MTIVYDAFGPRPGLQKDWGFAALVEYGGRRILFDTGNDASLFARNVKQLGVDLSRLDAAVISHRHGDHTTGLEVLVAANATVPIYAPQEGAFFRGGAPKDFLARDASLPPPQALLRWQTSRRSTQRHTLTARQLPDRHRNDRKLFCSCRDRADPRRD